MYSLGINDSINVLFWSFAGAPGKNGAKGSQGIGIPGMLGPPGPPGKSTVCLARSLSCLTVWERFVLKDAALS